MGYDNKGEETRKSRTMRTVRGRLFRLRSGRAGQLESKHTLKLAQNMPLHALAWWHKCGPRLSRGNLILLFHFHLERERIKYERNRLAKTRMKKDNNDLYHNPNGSCQKSALSKSPTRRKTQ